MNRLWILFLGLFLLFGCGGSDTYSPTFPQPGGPSFTLTISPASQSTTANTPVTYTVTLRSAGGFSEPVSLSALGLPTGFSANFSPSTVTPTEEGTTAQLTVSSPVTTSFDVVGTAGSLVRNASATITIGGAPDFLLSATPDFRQFGVNTDSVTFDIRVRSVDGFSAPVTLSATTSSSNIELDFTQSSVTPTPNGTVSVLTVSRVQNLTSHNGREAVDVVVDVVARSAGRPDKTTTVRVRPFGGE